MVPQPCRLLLSYTSLSPAAARLREKFLLWGPSALGTSAGIRLPRFAALQRWLRPTRRDAVLARASGFLVSRIISFRSFVDGHVCQIVRGGLSVEAHCRPFALVVGSLWSRLPSRSFGFAPPNFPFVPVPILTPLLIVLVGPLLVSFLTSTFFWIVASRLQNYGRLALALEAQGVGGDLLAAVTTRRAQS